MQTLELATAVGHIVQALQDCDGPEVSPFFFVVGAGVSAPVVPLAPEITRDCRAVAEARGRTQEPQDDSAIEAYSHWFVQAYHQPHQRQQYLRSLIEGKPVSSANLRLAHVLGSHAVTNVVVTPNFDDFLSRALNLFGAPHIICDHPYTAERIDPERPDTQVVHVHGTYWFYDCCNLKDEVAARADLSTHTTATMAALLDRVLSRRSPLVLGYSGWEQDVIMGALRRRLSSRMSLRSNIYWFCYRGGEVNNLPAWLVNHPNVHLVLPTIHPATRSRDAGVMAATQQALPRMSITKEGVDTLSAQDVLDDLIKNLNLPLPALTADPLDFLAGQLKSHLSAEATLQGTIYAIPQVIQRIERARALEAEETKSAAERALEDVLDAVRRSRYREAIQLGLLLDLGALSREQLIQSVEMFSEAATSLLDDSKEELLGYEQTVSAYDELVRRFGSETAVQEQVAEALVNRAITLWTHNKSEEAIATYDEVVRRFGESTEPALQEPVAKALFNKGVTLGVLGRSEEEIVAYDEVLRRFGESEEPALQERVAKARQWLKRLRRQTSA